MTAAQAPLLQTALLLLALLWDFSSTAPAQLSPSEAEEEECPHATKYYLKEYELCCSRCRPGYYANETCAPGRDTTCLQCPNNRFTETWNFLTRCNRCPYCDSGLGFEVALPCNLTHMTKCRCMEGTHCITADTPEKCEHCEYHSECKPGTEVSIPGNRTSDTVCTPCHSGFYQNVSSLSAVCQPHTNCTAIGLQIDTPGSATYDSRCVPAPKKESDYYTLLITLSSLAALFLSTIIIIIICFPRVPLCRKLKNPKNEKPQLVKETLTDPPLPNSPKDPLLPDSQDPSELQRGSLNLPIQEQEILLSNTFPQRKVSQREPQGHIEDVPETAPEDWGSVRDWQGQQVTAASNSGFQLNGRSMTFSGNVYVYNGVGTGTPEFPTISPFRSPETAVYMPGTRELRLVSPLQEDGKEVHMSVEENWRGLTPFPIQ